ncbi:hypothetical protein BDZ89DRAFT_504146 [Hymenopellis radicata]|nr:hypothetical protein BDZ89DRAFT_504146 [Hymenopellis radicata]
MDRDSPFLFAEGGPASVRAVSERRSTLRGLPRGSPGTIRGRRQCSRLSGPAASPPPTFPTRHQGGKPLLLPPSCLTYETALLSRHTLARSGNIGFEGRRVLIRRLGLACNRGKR